MVKTREEAAKAAEASQSNIPGTCQLWTRTQFGAPSAGDQDRDGDADAVDGWKSEPISARHPDRNPPRGVPVAWSGGANGFGHRAVSLGNGKIRSTDAPIRGRVGTVDLGWFERNWGLKYLGWSDTITGLTIPNPPPPAPKPAPKPKPTKQATRYVTANLAWQLGGDKALLLELAKSADVLMLVECRTKDNKPLDVAKILGDGWKVQQSTQSAAIAGSVTAVRAHIKVRRSRLVKLADAGTNVQGRFLRVTVINDGGPVELIVGHNPLPSTGRMRQAETAAKAAVRRARLRRAVNPRRRWIQAGDSNTTPDAWAKVIHARHHFGVKPMVVCWSAGWGRVVTTSRRVAGSDHAVLTLTKENR